MESSFFQKWLFYFLIISQNLGIYVMAFEVKSNGICQIEEAKYPAVGFGTYLLQNEVCFYAILQAAELGYRIIDTATFYDNFEPIGNALKALGRHNFYIISKAWPDSHTPKRLKEDLKMTLEKLQTNYLDAYLLHWPNSKVPIEQTLQAMEELRKQKIIRHIGLSNVNANHLKRALELNIPIAWVQVEMHPLFYDPELLKFCRENSITVQAWAPLGRGRISQDAMLSKLGEKYGKNAAQIAIKWILQHGCLPLPCSTNITHMQQNQDINDFMLSTEEMHKIDERAKDGKRERIPMNSGFGFGDEFDFSYQECWPKK